MKLSSIATPSRREMLELQARLIDDADMPDDFEVEMESEAAPPIPVLYVRDSFQKPVVKIMPMRKGRYRVLDYSTNEDYYFSADFSETHNPTALHLHARVMNSVRLRK